MNALVPYPPPPLAPEGAGVGPPIDTVATGSPRRRLSDQRGRRRRRTRRERGAGTSRRWQPRRASTAPAAVDDLDLRNVCPAPARRACRHRSRRPRAVRSDGRHRAGRRSSSTCPAACERRLCAHRSSPMIPPPARLTDAADRPGVGRCAGRVELTEVGARPADRSSARSRARACRRRQSAPTPARPPGRPEG